MKYVPGPAFGQFSGSQGNTTASHNRFGSYLRNRVVPVNPNTVKQQTSRELLSGLSSDYRDLTQVERDAWKALGVQIIRLDVQGQSYTLTGLQAYQVVNRLRISAAVAVTAVAPAFGPESNFLTLGLVVTEAIGITTATLTFTPTPLPAGVRAWVYATPPVSPGRSFFSRGEYRLIAVTAAAPTSPQAMAAAYNAVFGHPTIGQKISFKCFAVSSDYLPGAEIRADAIVT